MVQPNSACIGFCNWLLNISSQRLSGPQRVIVTDVYNAALGVYPVSDQTWLNFNLFTAWRNNYYLVFLNYASQVAPNLNAGLISSYNLEGNSNDLVGANNGIDTAIVYNNSYGKILQGALFDGVTSQIAFTPFIIGNTYSIGFWFNPSAGGSAYSTLITSSPAGQGLYWRPLLGQLDYFASVGHIYPGTLSLNAWHCVVCSVNAGVVTTYINGILSPLSFSIPAFQSIGSLGNDPFSQAFAGYMDIINFWNRALTPSEADQFYNLSAGRQYPF